MTYWDAKERKHKRIDPYDPYKRPRGRPRKPRKRRGRKQDAVRDPKTGRYEKEREQAVVVISW